MALDPEVEALEEQDQGDDLARWKLFVDGSSNQHGCGAGLILQTPSGEQMEYVILYALDSKPSIMRLNMKVATELGVKSLDAFNDSQLVVNQVQGDYLAKDL